MRLVARFVMMVVGKVSVAMRMYGNFMCFMCIWCGYFVSTSFIKKNCFKSAFSTLVFHIFRNFLFFYIIYSLYKWTRGDFNISMLFSSHHGRLLIIWNDIECHCELRFTKRGMVKWGFLDNGDNYSGIWGLIFMIFCMVGSFLRYFERM